mmetsp:Transcript_1631/g.5044  ORF Transcript_1631/g.5044 Transcript_1631/m.5044 type:complete len:241 (-) Transcript_1631:1369-2091(-)
MMDSSPSSLSNSSACMPEKIESMIPAWSVSGFLSERKVKKKKKKKKQHVVWQLLDDVQMEVWLQRQRAPKRWSPERSTTVRDVEELRKKTKKMTTTTTTTTMTTTTTKILATRIVIQQRLTRTATVRRTMMTPLKRLLRRRTLSPTRMRTRTSDHPVRWTSPIRRICIAAPRIHFRVSTKTVQSRQRNRAVSSHRSRSVASRRSSSAKRHVAKKRIVPRRPSSWRRTTRIWSWCRRPARS